MPESGPFGFVRGAPSNGRPYRDPVSHIGASRHELRASQVLLQLVRVVLIVGVLRTVVERGFLFHLDND